MVNQPLAEDSALMARSSKKVPSQNLDSAFQTRMREVLGTESVTAFGRRCGIGEGTLRSYLNGTLPIIDKATSIADTANVNIEWLATGRGPKLRGAVAPTMPESPAAPPLDELLLARAIGAVEEGLRAVNRSLPPDKHAKLILAAYSLLGRLESSDKATGQAIGKARAQVVEFIKLAA